MTYKEIIENNSINPEISAKWWTKYAFHYTDITNAISILNSGFLYSRKNANAMGLMQCDNASRQVIEMTRGEATSYVRFYFRPKTPTQYYNEGFKHAQLRYDGDLMANMPVPVFFLFDLEKLLSYPETKFSQSPQSGSGSTLYNTPEDFSTFNFAKIYGDGPLSGDDKRFRHAEIVYPDSFDISRCLMLILCRNDIEKLTLLNYLKSVDDKTYYKYKDMIKVHSKDVYMNNGLFVTDCKYHKGIATVMFSDTSPKRIYTQSQAGKLGIDKEKLNPVSARAEFDWMGTKKTSMYHEAVSFQLKYTDPKSIFFKNLEPYPNSKYLRIKLYMEEMLVCFFEQSLSDSEVL
jgi:hypothetical protein